MATTDKYVQIQDDNAACTGNANRCLKAPANYTGSVGDYFALATALANGFTEDPNCAGFNAASTDCSGNTNPGTSTAISRIGVIYSGGTLFVVDQATGPTQVRLVNASGTALGDWIDDAGYDSNIGSVTYNRRAIFNSVPAGFYTIQTRLKADTSQQQNATVSLSGTMQLAIYPSSTTPDPTPTTTTLNRAAIQYTPSQPTFILVNKTGPKTPEVRIFSNGFESGWVGAAGFDTTVESETYETRASIPNVPQGTHQVQFRFSGDTTALATVSITVGSTVIAKKIYPAALVVDRIGIFYAPGSYLFVSVQGSQQPQIRVFGGNWDSGWVDTTSYQTSIGNSSFNYRSGSLTPPQGIYAISVRYADQVTRQTVNDISLGAVNRIEVIYPTTGQAGNCSINITSSIYDYTNNRMTAVVSSSGLSGALEYTTNLTAGPWVPAPEQITNLANGDYILYGRDSGNTACLAQRVFSVGCTQPVQNVAPFVAVSGGMIQTIGVDYGTNQNNYRYIVIQTLPNNGGQSLVFQQDSGPGGTRTLTLGVPRVANATYQLRVQTVGNLTCERVVALTVAP